MGLSVKKIETTSRQCVPFTREELARKKLARQRGEEFHDPLKKRRPRRYHDGDGLYFQVRSPDNCSWQFRYQKGAAQYSIGLGSLADFSLDEPKEKAPRHRATYTLDKTSGEFRVRLVGPDAANAEGSEIPVTEKNGHVQTEKLLERTFLRIDDKDYKDYEATGQPLAIYKIAPRARVPREKKPFVF